MNAKKIMGAVLVALLAAALFVGAGAAEDDGYVDLGVLYTYTDLTAVGLANGQSYSTETGVAVLVQAVRINGADKPGFAVSDSQIVKNTYYYGKNATKDVKFKLATPTASVSVTVDGESIVDGSTDIGNTPVFAIGIDQKIGSLTVRSGYDNLVFINPDGAQITITQWAGAVGKWGVKVNLSSVVATGGPKYSEPVYFTITDDESEPTISANKDTLLSGNVVLITVNDKGIITYDKTLFTPVANQIGAKDNVDDGAFEVTKKGSYAFKATTETGDATFSFDFIQPTGTPAEVDVTVEEGEITANAEFDSYFIGDTIKLEGTNTVNQDLHIYIKGTNFKFTYVGQVNAKEEWSTKITKTQFKDADNKKPDAGSYTIYVSTEGPNGIESDVTGDDAIYTTAVVALKQPFISVTSAPSVVVKGDKLVIEGTAESATEVWLYIFGTNYFFNTTVGVKDSVFEVKHTITDDVAPGQYFAVIQHPMYDTYFNIAPFGKDIYLNTTSDDAQNGKGSILFNVDVRQTANAAEALCQALDSENIDDMYVKLSYIVANGMSVINPIPSEVAQGTKLTVSGSTNGGAGTPVTVEMMSTAFAAVPKDTVGSASFISLTTKTDKDGNWEVTFDTTGLNVDEYTVTAAVAQYETTATAKVNVIEGAPVTPDTPDTPDVPDTPDTPDTPTEPTTPGFGALAALAGLGAVAVLLLRRE